MIEMIAGSSLNINLTLNGQNGSPINLAGATITVNILGPLTSPPVYTPSYIVVPASVTSATAGQCLVTLSPSQIPSTGAYQYQCLIQYPNGSQFYSDVGRIVAVAPIL